ncbi:acyltransferase family protein [Symbioplanes lichenis]|uniref:acyltransferase family protein n=1 Tax=Symbioplanes lichenis TaxID=1629072 RepID=UPI0027397FDA|nr:acyltransferase [Actinoplanes lichenis]
MRNRYLDVLRAVAIARVVIYHSTGWAALTIAVPAMSVMFAMAGSLMAASIDRSGPLAVERRMRRLLPSLWAIAGIAVPIMLLTGLDWNWRVFLWAMPVQDAPVNGWGAMVLNASWYLRDFLWFVLLSPLLLPVFRRFPRLAVAVPYAALAILELGDFTVHPILHDMALYGGAWLLGFAHHDGLLRRINRKILVGGAGLLAAVGAAWFLTHPGPRGYDLNDIPLGNALWSAAFILIALGFAPLATRARSNRLVTVLNARALTIYLWHVPIIVGVMWFAERHGLPTRGWDGFSWRIPVVVGLVAVAVMLFGWVEDFAAGRPPRLFPGGRPRSAPVSPAPALPPVPVAAAPGPGGSSSAA